MAKKLTGLAPKRRVDTRLFRFPIEDDDMITLVFFPGVQLSTGKKDGFLIIGYMFSIELEARLL